MDGFRDDIFALEDFFDGFAVKMAAFHFNHVERCISSLGVADSAPNTWWKGPAVFGCRVLIGSLRANDLVSQLDGQRVNKSKGLWCLIGNMRCRLTRISAVQGTRYSIVAKRLEMEGRRRMGKFTCLEEGWLPCRPYQRSSTRRNDPCQSHPTAGMTAECVPVQAIRA
jgi:hypothetical protein